MHFRRGVDTSRIRETLRQHGAGLEERDGSSVLVETNGRPVRQLLSDLEENPLVADAEPNRIFTVAGAPNDPLYEHQRPYLETAGLPDAWATTKGTTGTTVAILDTGIDLDHPEFAGRILPGRDFVNNDADPTDDEGHGTMVAGVAAAAADNGIGIAGAAGGVSILPVKVLDRNGQGDTWQISEGIKWAVAQGADVLNFSFTGGGSDRFDDAVRDAVRRNVVIVAAAGNDGEAWPYLPRSYENVLTVAATDHAGTFAWFSNHGPLVELAAPGVDITTTARAPGAQDAYAVASGTSFSTPLVSGAAALVRSVHPDWTVDQVARRLERTARDAGPPGVDDSYGFGIVDAASALADRRRTALPSVTGAEEPNNVLARATTFTGSAGGTISPEGDVDWFATTLAAPGWVTVRLTGPAVDPEGRRPEELDPVLKVYDPAGDPLRTSDGGSIGDPEGVLVPVATSGRYLIRVENYVGSRSPGPYTIEVAPAAAPARFAPATEQTL
ncbi:MAG TPA: S8 family serine peptidase, partial [Actinomycetota bacterium]|nr:S8 family serine peptidase [Actinomycetota bacterium]